MNVTTEATYWLDRADDLLALRDLSSAYEAFHCAEALGASPDACCGGRWLASMLSGNFAAAWQESDALRQRDAPDPHRFWNGESIAGKHVIVRALHGFGDTVQMLRYAPLLLQTAASVVYEVPPRFLEVAPHFRGVTNVVTWGEQAPVALPAWDLQIEIMELSYLFRTSVNALPIATRYLNLPLDRLGQTAAAMHDSGKPRIGLVWTGGEWNLERSVPFGYFNTFLKDFRFSFWNLQGGPSNDVTDTRMHNAKDLCGDGILALATTIAHLDLVITVDTLAAHLAGALGKPIWLLLQHTADWRWMTNRTDSPWYPSMRIFRQPEPGDWSAVILNVLEALEDYAY
jgi:hypothetical protein